MKTHLTAPARTDEPRRHSRAAAGFSIVEVMVALMVMAVGMLGIASLYVTTLRSSGSAMSRMQAVNLASDLADRIRANRLAKAAYTTPAEHDCSGTTDCTKEQMAANDRYVWEAQIDSILGQSARGQVTYTAGTATTPDTYTIGVFWTERVGDGSGTNTNAPANEELNYTLTMQVEP